MVRDMARNFAATRLAPNAARWDREASVPREVIAEMGRLGLLGMTVPEQWGGAGTDFVSYVLAVEEIAAGDGGVSTIMNVNNTPVCAAIQSFGSESQKERFLKPLAQGQMLGAFCLTEPQAGSDASNLRTRAERSGNKFVLNGTKQFVTSGSVAGVAMVFAVTDAKAGKHGISAFLVPMDLPGIHTTRFDDVGTLVVGRGSIFFEDVRVPAAFRLGDEGRGVTQVMQGFDFSRALIGLQCLAPAEVSLEETWKYVSERKAFGAPIASFEGVSFPLAEGETLVEAARLLCYKTLWLKDNNLPHTAEAAMVKWLCPKTAFDIIHNCLLLHGHGGYGKETPYQQRLRDVMGLEIGDGTAQIMKLIIAREKIGRIAVQYAKQK